MIEPRVLAKGDFQPSDITICYSECSNRKVDPAVEAQIDPIWTTLLQEAQAKGKKIWNGISYRVNELAHTDDGQLSVEFAPIDFKTRECLVEAEGYYALSEDYYRKGAFACSLVRTQDDYYIFVILSGLSNNKHKVDMLGGIVGDTKEVKSGTDLYEALYQELEEEAVITKDVITSSILKLVFLSVATNIGFHFNVQLSVTKDEISQRFQMDGKDIDIKDLLFVPAADLKSHLDSLGGYKPLLYKALH